MLLPNQVQQRGVNATVEVILQLLSGMNTQEAHPVLIVDLLPSRLGFHVNT